MLARSDSRGRVWASIPGLANVAGVTIEQCEKALDVFLSPDPYSRTKDHEGRRIEEIDGGWILLNHNKYRDLRDENVKRENDAERQRRHREKKKKEAESVTDCHTKSQTIAHTEAYTDTELLEAKASMSGKPDAAKRILTFLNERTGRNYRPVPSNLKPITARIKEGYTEDECRMVVAQRCRKWATDEKMAEYLRPKTLFNATNFNQYAGELEND